MVAVAVNIAFSLAFFAALGHVAIALATAISAWVNFVLLAFTLWRRNDFRPSPATLRRVAMIVLSAAAMGAVVAAMQWALPQWFASPALAARLVATAGTVLMAMIVYFGLVILTGGLDRQDLMRAVRRRRKPPAKPQA